MKPLVDMKNAGFLGVILALFFSTAVLLATPEEAEQAEEKARASFIEHFSTFIQDKNVMGRAETPDGKPSNPGPNKTQFNRDDGASYKSDLTYHDFSYSVDDKAFADKQKANQGQGQGQNKGPSSRTLSPFISNHGGLSEAGGSSQLERKMYELHDKFSKQEDEEEKKRQKKEDEEKGIKYRSTFKIETREVFKNDIQNQQGQQQAGGQQPQNPQAQQGAQGKQGDPNKKEEPEKVERVSIREEAKPEVTKVGEDSFGTISRSSKDKGFENDEKTLENSTFLREAAGRATQAWWDSTLANLNQRRVNKGMGSGGLGGKPELNEDTPTCADWAKKAVQEEVQALAKATGGKVDPKAQQEIQKQIDESKKKCEELSKLSYSAINPKFETKEDGKGEELKTGDALKEDPYARDLRNQLEVLKGAGKDVTKLQGNWKYSPEEGKQELTIGYDENGEPNKKENWDVKDQLDSYNEQLDEAAKGVKDVKDRYPQLELKEEDITKYKIEPETQTAMEINGLTQQQKEDFGVQDDPKKAKNSLPENYDELVIKSKGPASR